MQFGCWTVVELSDPLFDKRGYKVNRWRCRCECGVEADVIGNSLRTGRSKSCGCTAYDNRAKTARDLFSTHHESKTRLYKIWAGMKKRCYNEKATNYKDYGGRGISVCNEWMKYESFRGWAINNGYSDTLSIDRIDVDGNYCPENCRWTTCDAQARNRRNTVYYTFENETKPLIEWADQYGFSYKYANKRLHNGQSIEDFFKH